MKKTRRQYKKEYYYKNKDKCFIWMKRYKEKNKKTIGEYQKEYYQKNKEKINRRQRKYERNKYKTNPKERISQSISRLINHSLKSGKESKHWESIVDYTLKDLMMHLEKQFKPQMCWNNHGLYWQIDHIVPTSAFNYDSINQLDFKRCWALENLQPLEKTKNLKKGKNINKSFQPCLRI